MCKHQQEQGAHLAPCGPPAAAPCPWALCGRSQTSALRSPLLLLPSRALPSLFRPGFYSFIPPTFIYFCESFCCFCPLLPKSPRPSVLPDTVASPRCCVFHPSAAMAGEPRSHLETPSSFGSASSQFHSRKVLLGPVALGNIDTLRTPRSIPSLIPPQFQTPVTSIASPLWCLLDMSKSSSSFPSLLPSPLLLSSSLCHVRRLPPPICP